MPQVFISYRRIDSAEQAQRLASALKEQLGEDKVFFDIDNLRPGENFDDALHRALEAAETALVLIGPQWLAELNRRLPLRDAGQRDYVFEEVAGALEHGLRVVPVLAGGATMPDAKSLPAPLAALARRNAFTLPPRDLPEHGWEAHIDRLAESIGKPYRWGWLALRAVAWVVLSVYALLALNLPLATAQLGFAGALVAYALAEAAAAFWRWRGRRWRN